MSDDPAPDTTFFGGPYDGAPAISGAHYVEDPDYPTGRYVWSEERFRYEWDPTPPPPMETP